MKTKTFILALAFGLISLISCKDDNPTEPDLYKNGDGYYYAEVELVRYDASCYESRIIIPDTTGLKEILGGRFNEGRQGYPNLFIAIKLSDSLAVEGTKIRLKLREPTQLELNALPCPDTVEPLPTMLMVTEAYRLKDK